MVKSGFDVAATGGATVRPIVALSDDLTGAAACAADFARARRRVALHPWSVKPGEVKDTVVLDAASRGLHADDAYRRVRTLVASWCPAAEERAYYHRVDSALRGNVRAELEAVCDELSWSVVLATAAPAYGVTTVDGFQLSAAGRERVARHAPPPVHEIGLEEVQGTELRQTISTALERGGSVVCDSATAADLIRVGSAVADLSVPAVVVGSYGLGSAWARAMTDAPRPQGGVLACSSSLCDATRAQVELAAGCGVGVFAVADRGAAARTLRAGRDALLVTTFPGDVVPAEDPRAAEEIATAAVELASASTPGALVLVGGELASSFVQAAGSTRLEIVCEPWPATPVVRLRGGTLDGTVAVLKSGSRGDEAWLLYAIDTAAALREAL